MLAISVPSYPGRLQPAPPPDDRTTARGSARGKIQRDGRHQKTPRTSGTVDRTNHRRRSPTPGSRRHRGFQTVREIVTSSGERLQTRRLVLRRPSVADIETIYSIHSDPRACEHNPGEMLRDRREAVDLFRRWDEHWSERGYGYFVVDLRGDGATIGFCGVKRVVFRGRPALNLFYRLDPAFWERGFATEAAGAVVRHVDSGVPELDVVAKARPTNAASHRVLAKLGLVRRPSLDEAGEDGLENVYVRRRLE